MKYELVQPDKYFVILHDSGFREIKGRPVEIEFFPDAFIHHALCRGANGIYESKLWTVSCGITGKSISYSSGCLTRKEAIAEATARRNENKGTSAEKIERALNRAVKHFGLSPRYKKAKKLHK